MTTRILLVSTNLARGGAEAQVAQLARTLHSRGWEVSVFSLLRPSAFEEELRAAGIPVHWSPARLVPLLNRLKPPVVHAHMFHGNLAARAARLVCPVPVLVSTIHSVAETGRHSSRVRARDWAYRLTDRLSDRTVCVSRAVAERHAAARAVSPRRLRVIPNGVDTQRFRPDPQRRPSTRAQLGIGDEFAWLAVGRLMWKKNYPLLLEAMARLRRGSLWIAGEGPDEPELRARAAQLGIAARFLGSRPDIPDLMNACDGLVLSSLVEGLPMVLLEAAACGLPRVATRAGGVTEAVLDGKTGLVVPPGDAVVLSQAMAHLMDLPAPARAAFAEAARRHAVECFDLPVVAGRWEQLYAELWEANCPAWT